MKIFENNADGSASFRILGAISDIEKPVLCMDTSKTGDNFVFGCQDGKVYVFNYKIEEGDFEGYQGGSLKINLDKRQGGYEDEEEKGGY